MPCYHPLPALYTEGEKPRFAKCSFEELQPWTDGVGRVWRPIQIPCGQCVGCRIAYSKTWANRCVCESLSYPEELNWFVTLTYDNDHVPVGSKGALTLRPADLSAWIKRLRRKLEYLGIQSDGVRFFGCGEYGGQTLRPHFHVLLFNAPLTTTGIVARNNRGDCFYNCPEVNETWHDGYVIVGRFNWLTAAYTARYVLKKQKGIGKVVYKELGIEPEFTRMSRRPGIGLDWFLNHYEDVYEHDNIVLPAVDGKKKVVKPPHYFDSKYELLEPERFREIKDKREELAKISKQARLSRNHMTEEEYLTFQEEKTLESIKKLPRNFV